MCHCVPSVTGLEACMCGHWYCRGSHFLIALLPTRLGFVFVSWACLLFSCLATTVFGRSSRFLLCEFLTVSGYEWFNFGVAISKVKVRKRLKFVHISSERIDRERSNWCHFVPVAPGAIKYSEPAGPAVSCQVAPKYLNQNRVGDSKVTLQKKYDLRRSLSTQIFVTAEFCENENWNLQWLWIQMLNLGVSLCTCGMMEYKCLKFKERILQVHVVNK